MAAAVVAAGEGGKVRVGSAEVIVRVPLNIRNPATFPENESKTLTKPNESSDQCYFLVLP